MGKAGRNPTSRAEASAFVAACIDLLGNFDGQRFGHVSLTPQVSKSFPPSSHAKSIPTVAGYGRVVTTGELKQLLYLPPFGPLCDPRLLADLAAEAEAAGWDGIFLWDHVLRRREEVIDIADPGESSPASVKSLINAFAPTGSMRV